MDEVTELIEKLKHVDWRVRRDAAVALGEIQDPRAVPALIVKLKSKNIDVRTSASEALWKFKDPRVVPILIEVLKDSDATVRLYAAVMLGEIASRDPSPALRDALPTLRRLRHSYKFPVFQETLDKIEAATAGMKDLPLPAAAPLPDATSLPMPSSVPAMSPDNLPVPSASTADNTSDCPRPMPRSRHRWFMREKRH